MGISTFDGKVPIGARGTIVNVDGTLPKSLLASQPNAFRLDALVLTNTDTVTHHVHLYSYVSPNTYDLGAVAVPAGAGQGGVPAVEWFQAMALTQLQGLAVTYLVGIYWSVEVAVTAGKAITGNAFGALL